MDGVADDANVAVDAVGGDLYDYVFFFSSRRRHTRFDCDWSSDVCSSDLADGVKRGGTIAAGMQAEGQFPSLAIHMVRVGEETGRLEDMLLKVAETFEGDVNNELKRVLGLLQPAIILSLGVLVAFIVVAMMLAIFSINEIPL